MPGHENVPDCEHQYVGRTFTYLPGMPVATGPRASNLVMRAGDKVRVIATFRNWNGVKGLDVLYVANLDSTNGITRSHVTVGDLGVLPLHVGDEVDLFPSPATARISVSAEQFDAMLNDSEPDGESNLIKHLKKGVRDD